LASNSAENAWCARAGVALTATRNAAVIVIK
jgi:hypothetical protein